MSEQIVRVSFDISVDTENIVWSPHIRTQTKYDLSLQYDENENDEMKNKDDLTEACLVRSIIHLLGLFNNSCKVISASSITIGKSPSTETGE